MRQVPASAGRLDGTFVLDWGIKGEPGGKESRPNYMNVHGVAVDADVLTPG